jgi:hypothetical protein
MPALPPSRRRHGLSGHPLLQLSSLIDLADRLQNYDGGYWSNGPAAPGRSFR